MAGQALGAPVAASAKRRARRGGLEVKEAGGFAGGCWDPVPASSKWRQAGHEDEAEEKLQRSGWRVDGAALAGVGPKGTGRGAPPLATELTRRRRRVDEEAGEEVLARWRA